MAEKLHERTSYHTTLLVCAVVSAACALVGLPAVIYCAVVAHASTGPPNVPAGGIPTPRIGLAFNTVLICSALLCLIALIVSVRWLIRNWKSNDASNEALEKSIEEILARKNIAPDDVKQSSMETPTVDPQATPPKLDGEIYRIVRSDKTAYSDLTRQFWEGVNPGKEFAIDIDILVEMYVVNTSSEAQYIRDFCASVEIDGARVPLIREQDFSAFEILDEQWEYCLDSTSNEPPIVMNGRSETLTPLFASLPTSLAPSQPAEGWVRFLLKERDPRKLEENRTYKFVLKDSLGAEHEISRAANPQRTTPSVKSRKKRV
jgi:hypothetical protein